MASGKTSDERGQTKHHAMLKAICLKLRAAGKKPRAAPVACLRKLVELMNRRPKRPRLELTK
jgi:hypothetical protein